MASLDYWRVEIFFFALDLDLLPDIHSYCLVLDCDGNMELGHCGEHSVSGLKGIPSLWRYLSWEEVLR